MSLTELIILVCIGLGAGFMSGMFGIGGGMVIVPALVFFLGMSQYAAQGTSLGLMLLPIGILAAANYYRQGQLNVTYGLIIAGTFVAGGYLGSKVALGLNELLLKRIFGSVMLLVALRMIFFSK